MVVYIDVPLARIGVLYKQPENISFIFNLYRGDVDVCNIP